MPVSYGLTAAGAADVLSVEELSVEELSDAARLGSGTARRPFGGLACRSEPLKKDLARRGVALATERADRRPATRQQVEVCFAALKRAFGLGATLAKTLAGLATRIAAKVCACTHTASTRTASWVDLGAASRSCGPEIFATLI